MVLCTPRYWHKLKSPHLYLAALLAVGLQVPTLIWNVQNDFASFGFHLYDRHAGPWWQNYAAHYFIRYFLYTVILFGPFLLLGMLRIPRLKAENSFTHTIAYLSLFVSGTTMAFLLSMVITVSSHWYWTDLAYLGLIILSPVLLGRRMAAVGAYCARPNRRRSCDDQLLLLAVGGAFWCTRCGNGQNIWLGPSR